MSDAPRLPWTVVVTEYSVSILPEDHIDHSVFEVKVAWRGNDRWAVLRGALCLDADGKWSPEPIPSSRTDEWIAAHRFDHDTAMQLAQDAVQTVKINGFTAADVLHAYES